MITGRIWDEFGSLAGHVESITHDTGVVTFKAGTTEAQMADINAIVAAHDAGYIVPWSRNRLLNKVREARELALNRLMGIAFAAKEANDAATVSAVLDARLALLNITAAPGVSTATNDAELGAALVMAYAAIVNSAPINVKTAFAGFNL